MFLEDLYNLNRLSYHQLLEKTGFIVLDYCWLSLPQERGWRAIIVSEIQLCCLDIHRHCLTSVDCKNSHIVLLFFSVLPRLWSSLLT